MEEQIKLKVSTLQDAIKMPENDVIIGVEDGFEFLLWRAGEYVYIQDDSKRGEKDGR